MINYQSILKNGLENLKGKYPIQELALFGSVTRPDFNPETSDIDILVSLNKPIGIEFIDLADELELLLGKKVDLLTFDAIKPHYWEHIKNDLIYVA